ncbi:SLATT domain-containing protein [Streptomyces sp. BHT-5-2]|uniref:SLATT domain-containing protein n=1 Tax=unclassified Streptomyces TaxID=2593676 RepID=UPI001C8E9971|nr:SLATT domain-containing protein [Streptomyces sp. BHT-5-2]QZL02750.1 SLATT domain-containing protein [Streptomyces sp. BHT-5-2]
MSQPEMQPEGPPRGEGGSDRGRGRFPDRHRPHGRPERRPAGPLRGRGDLVGRAFPHGDWGEPGGRLDALYLWSEEGALRTADWYLRDRLAKRRGARALRLGAAAGAAASGTLPLLDLAGVWEHGAPWGALTLLLAAVCVGCDRYFGMTAGWMRDLATAQAIHRRLEALQFDWATESVREVLGPAEGTASEAAERCLGVLRRFNEDIGELVRTETTDWMVAFRSAPVPQAAHAALPWSAARQEGGPGQQGRYPRQPGTRPNMPRQRPPEAPR